jgi:hypothetical protein
MATLGKIFVESVQEEDIANPLSLYLESPFLKFCEGYCIILVCFLPHLTHLVQRFVLVSTFLM